MSDTEKEEALVQLAGSVAHELNNIFTAVAGNLSLLEASLDDDRQKVGLVNDVIRTANRGIELSQKLQAFAGRQKLNRTRFDMNQSVASVIAGLKRSILRSIDVELVLLPASCMVAADEQKFQHVVEELLKNASAAMDHRGWIVISTNQLELQDGPVRKDYEAREADGAERDAWWARAIVVWPDFLEYEKKTTRVMPLFVLTPKDDA